VSSAKESEEEERRSSMDPRNPQN